MHEELVTFTPALAREYLERGRPPMFPGDHPQRKIDEAWVVLYARQMKAGLWAAMPSAVVLREDGRLMNGSHTLSAVCAAGVAVDLFVTRGAPAELWKHFDRPRTRSVSDAISHISPWHAGPCRIIAEKLITARKVSLFEIDAVYANLGSALNSLFAVQATSKLDKRGSVPLRTAAAVRWYTSRPDQRSYINEIWRQHLSGRDVEPFMEAVHNRLSHWREIGGSMGQSVTLAFGWKIFNPQYAGTSPTTVHMPNNHNEVIAEMIEAYKDASPIRAAEVVARLRKVS